MFCNHRYLLWRIFSSASKLLYFRSIKLLNTSYERRASFSYRLLADYLRESKYLLLGAIIFIHAVVALVKLLIYFTFILIVWSFYIADSISSGSFSCVNCKCLEILSWWVTGFQFHIPSSNFRGVFRGVAETHFLLYISIETKMADSQVTYSLYSVEHCQSVESQHGLADSYDHFDRCIMFSH